MIVALEISLLHWWFVSNSNYIICDFVDRQSQRSFFCRWDWLILSKKKIMRDVNFCYPTVNRTLLTLRL